MRQNYEKQSPIEVDRIIGIHYNNGICNSREFSMTIEGFDGHGNHIEQDIYFDTIDFLRWFDKDSIETLKEKIINEVKSL